MLILQVLTSCVTEQRIIRMRQQAEQVQLAQALLPYLGRLVRSDGGAGWTLRLAPETRVPLARAQQIERDMAALRQGKGQTLVVIPPLQSLPAIPLVRGNSGEAAPDTGALATLDTQAWALQRWQADSVDVTLTARNAAVAAAWEEALQTTLAAHGLRLGRIERRRGNPAFLQLTPGAE